MDYFDGNTVTGLWNYAQNYAMSDNNYNTEFGPSTPGALNLVSGQDRRQLAVSPTEITKLEADPGTVSALNRDGLGTIYGDLDPAYDDCSKDSHAASENRTRSAFDRSEHRQPAQRQEHHVGLVPGRVRADRDQRRRKRGLRLPHTNIVGATVQDYMPHHDPFQYYKSTANPQHLPPARRRPSGAPTRPTTSTTCRCSTPRSRTGTCPRSAS